MQETWVDPHDPQTRTPVRLPARALFGEGALTSPGEEGSDDPADVSLGAAIDAHRVSIHRLRDEARHDEGTMEKLAKALLTVEQLEEARHKARRRKEDARVGEGGSAHHEGTCHSKGHATLLWC